MLMGVIKQISTWMAQASEQFQKETSLSWLYFKYLGEDFHVICRRIHYGQLSTAWFSSYDSLPCFLPAQEICVAQSRTSVYI